MQVSVSRLIPVQVWDQKRAESIQHEWDALMMKCGQARVFPVEIVETVEYSAGRPEDGDAAAWHDIRQLDTSVVAVRLSALCRPAQLDYEVLFTS
jgi:hypothetical protein